MEHAMLLARIFGPFFTIVAIWMYFRMEDIERIWASIKTIPAFLYIGGVLNLLIGFAILGSYDTWSWNLALFLTIAGWLLVIRGVLALFVPQQMMRWMDSCEPYWKHMAIIPLVFGLCLSYLAFV